MDRNNRTFLTYARTEDARNQSPMLPNYWRPTPSQRDNRGPSIGYNRILPPDSRKWHGTKFDDTGPYEQARSFVISNDPSTSEKKPTVSSYVITNNIQNPSDCNRSISGEALLKTPAPKRTSLLPTPKASLLPLPKTPPSTNLLSYPPNPSISYPARNSYTVTNFTQPQLQKLAIGSICPDQVQKTLDRPGERPPIPLQLAKLHTNYPTPPPIELSTLPTPKVKYLPGYGKSLKGPLAVERPPTLQQPKKHNNSKPLKHNQESETNYIDEIQSRISTNLFDDIVSKTRDPTVLVNCIKALTEIRQMLPQPGHGMISVKDKKSVFMALNDTLQFLHNSYSEQNQYRHLTVLDCGSSQVFSKKSTYRSKQEFVKITALSILKFLENNEDISKLNEIDINYDDDLVKIPEHSQWIYKLKEELTEDCVELEPNAEQPEELDGLIEPDINLLFDDDSEFVNS